jgi:methanogenic corrinoid protein MtbC1
VIIDSEHELIAQRHDMAALIKSRLDTRLFNFGSDERLKMIFDLEMHLAFLGEAVRCGVSKIFIQYAVWSGQLLVNTGMDMASLVDCFKAIDAQILESGRGSWTEKASAFIADALQQMRLGQPICQSYITPENPHYLLAQGYLQNCLSLKRKEALEQIQQAVKQGIPVYDIYLQVITPVLHELGRLWQQNQITIGQEHYSTALAQMAMSQLFPWVFDGSVKTKRLVSACVAGELHEIGARMVSDLFEMHGWDTVFLGADVPIESVIDTVIQYDANVLAISATLGCHLGAVADMIKAARATPDCQKIKILVGGSAFNVDSSLWQVVGADGWAADAQVGIDLANQWSVRQ